MADISSFAIQQYDTVIDRVFGKGTARPNRGPNIFNRVLGAFGDPEYHLFVANFTARLQRLYSLYRDSSQLKHIITAVHNIASTNNWQGAFAELAAYDYLNEPLYRNNRTYLYEPVTTNVKLPTEASFAAALGKKETDLDGNIPHRSLYFDVKSLKDNVSEIFEGIYADFRKHIGMEGIAITASFPRQVSAYDIQQHRQALLTELIASLSLANQDKYLVSKIIAGLTYRILWGSGLAITESSYSPYEHAQLYHSSVFNYANKLLKNNPTAIILVSFPWYNNVIRDFHKDNLKLYRSFARRVFCQYRHDLTLFSAFNSSFIGPETIWEVSRYISSIIFLEDKTILGEEPEAINIAAHIYLNPNAVHPLSGSLAGDYLRSLPRKDFEEFTYDNY